MMAMATQVILSNLGTRNIFIYLSDRATNQKPKYGWYKASKIAGVKINESKNAGVNMTA